VVGVDPSLTGTGLADPDGLLSTVTGLERDLRLVGIWHAVHAAAEQADLAVVEDLPVHGMGAGKTGMAQGVVRLALQTMLVPYVTVAPASLKKFATGRGSATKADMRMAAYQRAGLDLRDDNQCDAWWLRQLGLAHYSLAAVMLPRTHLDALAKVDWAGAPAIPAPPATTSTKGRP
jgi:Holliday junction resolvasome RuvABC endonuclease subunit